MDYWWQTHLYVQNPMRNVLSATLVKVSHDSAVAPPNRARCKVPAKGEWKALPPGAADCPDAYCMGSLGGLQLDSRDNREMGFRHVYVPQTCVYRMYDDLACLKGKRVKFVGNSRSSQLRDYFVRFANRTNSAGGGRLDILNLMPYNTGLRRLLRENMTAIMEQYDVVFLSSLVHDIANINPINPVEEVRSFFQVGPPTALPAPGSVPMCAPSTAEAALRHKYRPVQQYEAAVQSVLGRVREAREALQSRAATVFWLFHGVRVAAMSNPCYANTVDRMACLQHLALQQVVRAGVTPIDLATLQMDGPSDWFLDALHVVAGAGKVRGASGLELMSLQVVLNTACGVLGEAG